MSGPPQQTLSNVCDIAMGQAPKGSSYNTAGNGYALIAGAGDFGELTPTPSKYTDAPTKLSQPGDLLLCIRATIGDRNWSDKNYCLGRGVAGLRANEEDLSQAYLWYWIEHATPALKAKGRGATFLQVSKSDIASLQIPLPPLAEQKRIAKILDAADALRAKRRESLAQLDTLLQSTFLDMFGDPVTNPMGYPVREIGKLMKDADVFTDGDWVESKDQDPNGNVRLTQLADVGDGKWIDKSARYLTSEKASQLRCTYLAVGDVVVARMPDPLGRAAIFPGDPMPCVTVVDVCILRPNHEAILPRYLVGAINSPRVRHDIKGRATGTTRKRISRGNLKKVMLVAPPLDAQTSFADIAESVEEQKATQRAHLDELDTLFASLQSRAFRGNL